MTTEHFNKYFSASPTFELVNPNPVWETKKGIRWDRGDCVIRALANSLSISWLDAFDYTVRKARRDYYAQNDAGGFRKWVPESGGAWVATPATKGKRRMTATEFAETHKTGRYILYVANHFTACVNGKILDAWNCGDSCLVGYFEMDLFDINK